MAEAICGHEHRTQEQVQERRTSHRHHCVQAHEQCHLWEVFLQNVMKQSTLKFVNTLLDAIQIKVQSLPGFVRNVYHNGNFTIADVKHEEVK